MERRSGDWALTLITALCLAVAAAMLWRGKNDVAGTEIVRLPPRQTIEHIIDDSENVSVEITTYRADDEDTESFKMRHFEVAASIVEELERRAKEQAHDDDMDNGRRDPDDPGDH